MLAGGLGRLMDKSIYSKEYGVFLRELRAAREKAGVTQAELAKRLSATHHVMPNYRTSAETIHDVAAHAAGIADALRLIQFDDRDGDNRFRDIAQAFGGVIGIMNEIADAASMMEEFRAFLRMSVDWGEGLPHAYEVWYAIALGLWEGVGTIPTNEITLLAILRLLVQVGSDES